ncbi:hypothetical protein GQ473_01700 [archaeon]|nr:hypothetical protein [archaeon]
MKQRFHKRKGATLTYLLVFALGFLLASGIFIEYNLLNTNNTPTGNLIKNTPAITEPTRAEANMIAISENTKKAVMGKIIVEIVDGSSATLVDINPFVETDIQESATTAAEYAKTHSNRNLENKSIIYRFEVNRNTILVGGPSAGTAMAVATIAAIEDKQLKSDALVTGAITADGLIHPVGSIFEKVKGAGKHNISLFLIPSGQKETIIFEKKLVTDDILGFRIVRIKQIPTKIDVITYAKENYNMTIKEISAIDEAYNELIISQ